MLTAAEYTKARETYQARLAATVALMVGILNPIEPPEREPDMATSVKKKYRVTRTVTFLEVIEVVADTKLAARRMVETGHFTPRRVRKGASEYTITVRA